METLSFIPPQNKNSFKDNLFISQLHDIKWKLRGKSELWDI